MLTPAPLRGTTNSRLTCGKLIPRRSSGREEMTLSTRGIRSAERRRKVEPADARGRFKSIGIDTHFRRRLQTRHSIRSYVVNVKYGHDVVEQDIKPKGNGAAGRHRTRVFFRYGVTRRFVGVRR